VARKDSSRRTGQPAGASQDLPIRQPR